MNVYRKERCKSRGPNISRRIGLKLQQTIKVGKPTKLDDKRVTINEIRRMENKKSDVDVQEVIRTYGGY